MKNVMLVIFLMANGFTYAQSTFQVTGMILDGDQKGIDLALVVLLSQADSSVVKAEYTDEDGSFLLSNIHAGNYSLQISLLGYLTHVEPLEITNTNDLELDPILLLEDAILLDEVTVKAKVKYIERKLDKTVVTPSASISNAGSNALEILESVPGISMDNNGSILLKGRSGVSVFINDKPSYLSGTELENYLRSLPEGSIKHIEIMTNPPAKYEAAGNAGVINIILERNKLFGFHGNASTSIRQGKYTKNNNSINLNFNKNKFSFFANLSGGFYQSFQDLNINRYYKTEQGERLSTFFQNSYRKNKGKYFNGKTGIDYYFNDHTSVGVSYKNLHHPSGRISDNKAFVSNAINEIEQKVVADNLDISIFKSGLYSIYMNHKIDTLGSKISIDADYVSYTSNNDQTYKNFIFNPNGMLTYKDQLKGALPSEIKIYVAKTDYIKPLSEGSKFEAGLKTAFTETDNEAIYSTIIEGESEPNYDLSNRFLYEEWINAAYVNYTKSFGALDIQAGFRAESTKLAGRQFGNVQKTDTSFTRNYNAFFPTFYSSWKMDTTETNLLTFSYGRRIDRPYFQDLNPFIRPLDKFTFYNGNPDLLSTFSHNLSLSHTYRGNFNTTLSYSKTLDGIKETLEIRDGIYYSRPNNIAENQSLSLSFDGTFKATSWYDINSYAEVAHLRFESDLYTEKLNSSGTYFYLSATNSFHLGKGWKASISGRYVSDRVSAQLLVKSYGLLNLGVQKKILDGKGKVKLAVNDVFYTRRGDGVINNLHLTDADWNSKFDSRTIALSCSIRFGKSGNSKRKYKGAGSDSERKRVKG